MATVSKVYHGKEMEYENLIAAERLRTSHEKEIGNTFKQELHRVNGEKEKMKLENENLQHEVNKNRTLFDNETMLDRKARDRLQRQFDLRLEEYKNKLAKTEQRFSRMEGHYKKQLKALKAIIISSSAYAEECTSRILVLEQKVQKSENQCTELFALMSEADKYHKEKIEKKFDDELQKKDDNIRAQTTRVLDLTHNVERLQCKLENVLSDHDQLVQDKSVLLSKLHLEESERNSSVSESRVSRTVLLNEKELLAINLENRNKLIGDLTMKKMQLESEVHNNLRTISRMESNVISIATDYNLGLEKANHRANHCINLLKEEEFLRKTAVAERNRYRTMMESLISQKELLYRDAFDLRERLKHEKRMHEVTKKDSESRIYKLRYMIRRLNSRSEQRVTREPFCLPTCEVKILLLKEEIELLRLNSSPEEVARLMAELDLKLLGNRVLQDLWRASESINKELRSQVVDLVKDLDRPSTAKKTKTEPKLEYYELYTEQLDPTLTVSQDECLTLKLQLGAQRAALLQQKENIELQKVVTIKKLSKVKKYARQLTDHVQELTNRTENLTKKIDSSLQEDAEINATSTLLGNMSIHNPDEEKQGLLCAPPETEVMSAAKN